MDLTGTACHRIHQHDPVDSTDATGPGLADLVSRWADLVVAWSVAAALSSDPAYPACLRQLIALQQETADADTWVSLAGSQYATLAEAAADVGRTTRSDLIWAPLSNALVPAGRIPPGRCEIEGGMAALVTAIADHAPTAARMIARRHTGTVAAVVLGVAVVSHRRPETAGFSVPGPAGPIDAEHHGVVAQG